MSLTNVKTICFFSDAAHLGNKVTRDAKQMIFIDPTGSYKGEKT